jgi:hypothetical protein
MGIGKIIYRFVSVCITIILFFSSVLEAQDFFDAVLQSGNKDKRNDEMLQYLKVSQTLKELQLRYFDAPSDSLLLQIVIADQALGNDWRAKQITGNLKQRYVNFAAALLDQYQRLFLKGETIMAGACRQMLEKQYPDSIPFYFPSPELEIISPEKAFATNRDSIQVDIEINHRYPVDSVFIDGRLVHYFRRDANNYVPDMGERKTFNSMVGLKDGLNRIIVSVRGIYGKWSRDTVAVMNLKFGRNPDWKSALSDSLFSSLERYKKYIPENVYKVSPAYKFRLLVMVGNDFNENTGEYSPGLFAFDWMTNSVWGSADSGRSKILLKKRLNSAYVDPLMKKWLIGQNYKWSRTLLFLSGEWDIDTTSWKLKGEKGYEVDVLNVLKELTAKESAGVIVMVEGMDSGDSIAYSTAGSMVWGASSPLSFIFINGKEISNKYFFLSPGSFPENQSTAEINLKNINHYYAVDTLISQPQFLDTRIGYNPALKIDMTYSALRKAVKDKLPSLGVPEEKREEVMKFFSDWRRYPVAVKILGGEMNYADLKKIIFPSSEEKEEK